MIATNTALDRKANPRVFIVMPTYNRWDEARESLACLLESTYENLKIILVEDGCSDGTAEKCRAEFPDVEILHGNGNLWWSGAINKGVAHALNLGADAIVWLNDDNRVEAGTLSFMVESFKRMGERSIICARTKSTDTGLDEWLGDPPRWHPEFGKWTRPALTAPEVRVEHPPGGRGVLIPTRCFHEIGLVDMKTFPHYWADHDFHYRAIKAGYLYFLSTGALIWNVPNRPRPDAPKEFSLRGSLWFLTNRRSAMNMITLRRLLKRHLPSDAYRATYYSLLWDSLVWLASGIVGHKPLVHKSLRQVRRSFIKKRA